MDTKPWYESTTIWSSLGTVVISIFSVLGHKIDPTIVPDIAQQISLFATALTGVFSIYGRLTATTTISSS